MDPQTILRLKRVDAQDIGPRGPTYLAIWLFFQIAANHILLPLLVATFLFSSRVSRHPTVINVCCSWILAGIASCLLFYTGQHVGPEPPKGLCIAQTTLLSPIPPMASVAVLSLVCHTWLSFRFSIPVEAGNTPKHSRAWTVLLVAVPYITYVCFAAVCLQLISMLTQYSLRHPDEVNRSRRFFYCSVNWDPYNEAIALFTVAICVLAFLLEVHLVFLLFWRWAALRRSGLSARINLQLVIRTAIFAAYIICALIIISATITAVDDKSVVPDMFAASVGLAAFFVFSTQSDVLRAWHDALFVPRGRPPAPPRERTPTPIPSFDSALFERTDSETGEKARLAAIHAFFKARVQDTGVNVEIIRRPEDAFVLDRMPRRVWDADGLGSATFGW